MFKEFEKTRNAAVQRALSLAPRPDRDNPSFRLLMESLCSLAYTSGWSDGSSMAFAECRDIISKNPYHDDN